MPANLHTTHAPDTFNWIWDVASDSWIKQTASAAGGGGAATIANGDDVAEGATTDAAWVSGAGTVISLLKKIASAGGSAVSIADGSDAAEGTTTDAAVVTDVAGTVSGKLRGLVKMFASVWDSVNGRLKVDGSAVAQPVQGVNFDGITGATPLSPVTVGGHYLATQPIYSDDAVTSFGSTQRGALVVAPGVEGFPISAVALPLPTGASTSALQTTGNTSVGSIDTKTPALGQALAAASTPVVLTAIQQTALTPPAAITGFALEAGHLATIDARTPALGQAAMAASTPVVIASDQSSVTVEQGLSTWQTGLVDTGFGSVHVTGPSAAAVGTDSALVVRTVQLPAAVGQAVAAASLPVVLAVDAGMGAPATPIFISPPSQGAAGPSAIFSWWARISDGLNGPVAVKAASTAAVAADAAFVTRTVQLPTALAASGGLKVEGVAGGVAIPVAFSDGSGQSTTDAYNIYRLQEKQYIAELSVQMSTLLANEPHTSQAMGFELR